MRICLIDADSTIPNLALMKLSTYYKSINANITFKKLHISYYPMKSQKNHIIPHQWFDKIFCSVIFDGSMEYIRGKNITYGGTGYSLQTKLPEHIEALPPDYSLYPDNDTSYGFISRGCIRNCPFCKVPLKEGTIKQVNRIDDLIHFPKIKFLDNNFLALPNHKSLLQELIDKQIKCQFNQGLDIRLIDKENSFLLSKLNYWDHYTFAFDDLKHKSLIESKLSLLNWRKPWKLRFFVYIHPDMPFSSFINRIEFLKQNQCLPYAMRDALCWFDHHKNFYSDIAAWCNQPRIFKTHSFHEFLKIRYPINKRAVINTYFYNQNRS
jgi:hypothetical protein